jgi:hypothetical protein
LPLPGLELRPLGRSARSQSLYRLRYPGSSILRVQGSKSPDSTFSNPWTFRSVATAVTMKNAGFWVAALYTLVKVYRRFRGTCCPVFTVDGWVGFKILRLSSNPLQPTSMHSESLRKIQSGYVGFQATTAVVMPCNSEIGRRFGETSRRRAHYRLPPASANFLLGLFLDHEDGGDMFLQNIWLSPNCTALEPRRPHSSIRIVDLRTEILPIMKHTC